jgi:Phage integrase, N-terminal SAM-like domain
VVAEAWRKSRTNRLDARTRHGYDHYLKTYVLPQWGRAPVAAITPLVVQDWVHALQTGRRRARSSIEPSTGESVS